MFRKQLFAAAGLALPAILALLDRRRQGAPHWGEARRRRQILTPSHRHCIVSLHRFIEAVHGQDR
jgi:hypothetical protein